MGLILSQNGHEVGWEKKPENQGKKIGSSPDKATFMGKIQMSGINRCYILSLHSPRRRCEACGVGLGSTVRVEGDFELKANNWTGRWALNRYK